MLNCHSIAVISIHIYKTVYNNIIIFNNNNYCIKNVSDDGDTYNKW